jgi:ferritin-like metal-binding protein YciE
MSDLGTNQDQSVRYDSGTEEAIDNELHSIQTYVSDMLALERHIAQPLKRQIELPETAQYAAARALITELHALNGAHVVALEQALAELGGHEASSIKSAWSTVLGAGAAAIDSVRKTKVSKNLRDDYTALNLAAISYTMLHATSVGLGDTTVASLAQRHLADYARIVMQIVQIVPQVVLAELQADGQSVQTGAAELIRQQTNAIWKSEADVTR